MTESILLKWVKTCPIAEGPALLKLFECVVAEISNQYKRLPSNKELNDILDGNRHELVRVNKEYLMNQKTDCLQIEDLSYLDKAQKIADKLKLQKFDPANMPEIKLKSVED